ncbi:S8 family serine peptidase [Sphingomonas sp. 3-13AW]|uniref:S8 family serine peptidase n=1 Tax=Sphingomonas sp. 3-13AW TaxID=3050450 RepID=UPI003BB4BC55
MSGNFLKGLLAGAALASAVPAQAEITAPGADRAAVAIIDISADKIDNPDPKVRFINLTPAPPEGRTFAKSRNGNGDHGDYVASAFVSEYRKMNASSAIDIYSVNPFLQQNSRMTFNRKAITDAIPVLKQNGVKVVITAFGIENKEAGESIVNQFRKAGMVVFAATPNSERDEGIYPAANKGAISVADDNGSRGALAHRKDWASWVDFAIDGNQQGQNGQWAGASFAVGKAAAYGVLLTKADPSLTVDDVRQGMTKYSDPSRYGAVRTVGGRGMVAAFSTPEVVAHLASLKAPVQGQVVQSAQLTARPALAAISAQGQGPGF